MENREPLLGYAAKLGIVVLVYFGSAKLGLALASGHSSITAIWPPTGIALAAILLGGYRMWPAVALGAFLTNLTTSAPIESVAGITAGNTLEAVIGAYLLSLVGFDRSLDRVRDVVSLVVLAAGLSTLVSASVGVFSLWAAGVLPGDQIAVEWRVWWLGDLGGDVLVAPAILVLWSRPSLAGGFARAEAVLLAAALMLVSVIVFQESNSPAYPVLPLLMWCALRFGKAGAVLGSLLVSGLAIAFTQQGHGPFVLSSPDADLLRAQTFVGVASVTALLVAVVQARRQSAEESFALLAERERQLAEAQEVAHVGSWEWDIPGDTVQWSDELYRIYGLDPESFEASYNGFLRSVHPEDRAMVEKSVENALNDRSSFQFVHRAVRPDGEVRTLEAHGRVICDEQGTPVKMVGTGQDITSFTLAEAKFRQLLEFAPDAIIGIGSDGRIELTNSQVEKLFGYPREQLLGKPAEMLFPELFGEDHGRHLVAEFEDPRTRRMGPGLELYARRRDGSEFPCEVSLSSIQTEAGGIGVAAVRDVTERKLAEAEAERLKSEFFALVSHELRTPLTSIEGYADLLSEQEITRLSEQGRGFLEVIGRNSRRLHRLVQDLLLITQVEAGSFGLDVGEVDAAELARECEQQAAPIAEQDKLELHVSVEDIPRFAGDHDRLTQVLDNLVTNAIKFTPPGGRVDVSIGIEQDRCVFQVSDTGIGIPAEELPHLFDRFHRSRAAGGAHVPGIGLGLAIVKTIVESHGGGVEVSSERGSGSTFRASVPMKPVVNRRSPPITLEVPS